MALSYNKLWKLLIDKGMTKTQMRLKADISTTTLAKLGKNETVSMEVLLQNLQGSRLQRRRHYGCHK